MLCCVGLDIVTVINVAFCDLVWAEFSLESCSLQTLTVKCCVGGLVTDIVAMFGIEFIIVFTALLLKKRIAVYHSDISQLLTVCR